MYILYRYICVCVCVCVPCLLLMPQHGGPCSILYTQVRRARAAATATPGPHGSGRTTARSTAGSNGTTPPPRGRRKRRCGCVLPHVGHAARADGAVTPRRRQHCRVPSPSSAWIFLRDKTREHPGPPTRHAARGRRRVSGSVWTRREKLTRASHPGTVLAIDDWEYSGWCCIFLCVKKY